MTKINRFSHSRFCIILLLAAPFAAGAYEVNILNGDGAESSLLNKGDYAVAIERLEKRVQYGGTRDRDIRLTNLCTAYVVTGDLEKARETCDRAVAANGKYVGAAYNSRGVLHAISGDYISAIADFAKAADESNYPKAQREFADKMPSMRRFGKPGADAENSIQLATMNHAQATQLWASVHTRMAQQPRPVAEKE